MTDSTRKWLTKPILIYLLIANGFTWLCWIPALVIGGQQGYLMPNIDTYPALFQNGFENRQHLLLAVIFQLGVYGPLIGGLVAVWMDKGREGLLDLWQRITDWHVPGRWYLTAAVITFLLAGIPVGIFGLATGFTIGGYAFSYILFILAVQLLTSGLGEEPGWRGFLLPRLQSKYQNENYVWMLGLIWAIWHYPLMIIQTASGMPDFTLFQITISILTSLAGFTMSIIGITYIYAWLYNQTKSVLLMILFHALSNTFSGWLPSFLNQPQMVTLFVALMPWAVVIFLQQRLGKEKFPG